MYDRFKASRPADISEDELEAHFRGMPPRYWESVTKNELTWGLETIHNFFGKLKSWDLPGAPVVASLRHCPERGFTKVLVCTWDRLGLLAKIAATFSALRISILQADVYTRSDDLAFDVFQVCDLQNPQIIDTARLGQLMFLLEGALNEPPRFISLWASEFHKAVDYPKGLMPAIGFDTDASNEHTVLRIEAADRLGLLYDILQTLTDARVNVAQAIIDTDGGIARDAFHITDMKGAKIAAAARLEQLRQALVKAIAF
jgi:[protein-PII] uridylyltransferase